MTAAIYGQYGGPEVFKLAEVSTPQPGPRQVLVRVHATPVTGADLMMRTGTPRIGRLYLGLRKPKRQILGFDFAGEVVALGPGVTRFKLGDRVFGGTTALGAYAQLMCVNEDEVIATIPDGVSFEDAAPFSGSAVTVWNFLVAIGKVKAGQQVLINGASGSLGTYAVQLARHLGAEVTAVCSGANAELVRSLGAHHVVDYTKEDFTSLGRQYDLIFDTVGKRSFGECKRALKPKGTYLTSVMGFGTLLRMMAGAIFGGKRAKTSATGMLPVKTRLSFFLECRKLLANGVLRSVTDKRYPLGEVSAAHAYVETGRKRGNAILLP